MKIGFIGLGIMGKPMVRNLLKAGHEVWVNNRSKAPMEELAKDGAHAVGAPVPMTASVQEILQWLHNNDCGGNDHSAIAKYYERLTGIKIGR